MSVPNLKLNDAFSIPQIGLGLWQVKNEEEFKTAFSAAIAAGYRHFDTAQAYHNEHMLGNAWTESGLKRDELFITTKIAVENFGAKHPLTSFNTSLEKLKTDYVDLLLLHFPVSILRKKSWLALQTLQTEGKVRSIGVSNYTIRHLKEMKEYANVTPAVNQVELHIFLQQPELIKYCHDNGIVVEAYSPLAHAKDTNEQVIKDIAEKHNKTYAQIMLRWCIEQNLVVIPKSVTPSRIKENINIFDFKFDKVDAQKFALLNKNLRTCWDPTLVP
jgi:diketogulonate reductase-like aldo/keto reductase